MENDLISRQAAIDAIEPTIKSILQGNSFKAINVIDKIRNLPSAQPELCEDAVSRQRLLSDLKEVVAAWKKYPVMAEEIKGVETAIGYVELIPSVKPNSKELSETHKALDTISRQAAIDALHMHLMYRLGTDSNKKRLDDWINGVPSVQPERTCVNCGRTANNGGWYADGRTRCPIEEHYALPKDGYCHLWEKRNVTDDDYPERREDGQTT